ncbi:MAG TPA: rod shape-determining protein MreD [Bacteroidia bacterium]|nr:rod shape-determining protein MreD [Bacteroidia bacterium]
MISVIFKHIIRFIFFIFLQVLVLNNIQFSGYINPYLYVFIILMLPFATPVWMVMMISLSAGLLIDMFQDTMGMHAAACVLMGYSRSFILKLFSPRDGYDSSTEPTLHYLGASWYFSYSLLLVLIHHFTFFFIEAYSADELLFTLTRMGLSLVFTMVLLFISQMMIYKPKELRKN